MKKFNLSKLKVRTILYASVIFTFFSVLFVFFISGIFTPDKEYSETENRKLSSFPAVSAENVFSGNFMNKFESYLSDQFVNRDTIVSFKTKMSFALGNREVNNVYIGKNNRLFQVPAEFNVADVDNKIELINSFSDNNENISRHFILVPNSSYILAEQLPSVLECKDQAVQISDIYGKLNKSFNCVDAVGVLSSAENKDLLYLKTDHHWTSEAASLVFDVFADEAQLQYDDIAYDTIKLSSDFSGTLSSSSGIENTVDTLTAIVPQGIENTFIVHNYDTGEKSPTFFYPEKLETKNHYEVFFGGNFSRIRIFTKNVNSRNILVIKDSYANCFIPMLIPHFENIVIIDPRYFAGNIDDVLADYNFTDILYLYNLNTFLEDTSIAEML